MARKMFDSNVWNRAAKFFAVYFAGYFYGYFYLHNSMKQACRPEAA